MGLWGAGLYSGDFALDLRSAIRAVARLPYDGDKLAEILRETEPGAADNPENEEHTTFWLVVADQFSKRGIVCERARGEALKIIDGGRDIAMHDKLGMSPADLRKRKKMLEEVRGRIAAPPQRKPRTVLKKPQAFLMEVGDVMLYPTCEGHCINPYFGSRVQTRTWRPGGLPWERDGWGTFLIMDRGRAFEFLTWYRPLTLAAALEKRPDLATLRGDLFWKIERAGTCSPVHFKRMGLENAGTLPIDPEKLTRVFPAMRPGISAAINDISISNGMRTAQRLPGASAVAAIRGIEQILS